jgi:hypothetical protein
MIALVPLTIGVQIGLGALLGRVFAIPEVLERTWLSGSAVLSLVGVALAAALIGARAVDCLSRCGVCRLVGRVREPAHWATGSLDFGWMTSAGINSRPQRFD